MLVDTSVLLRTLQPLHPQLEIARSAIKALTAQGRELNIVAQNLIGLRVVATRPAEQNGLGLTPEEAAEELARLKGMFVLLPETPAPRMGSSCDQARRTWKTRTRCAPGRGDRGA